MEYLPRIWAKSTGQMSGVKGTPMKVDVFIKFLEALNARDEEKSVLWKHSVTHHQGREDVVYSMAVTGGYKAADGASQDHQF